jgi:transaldolase
MTSSLDQLKATGTVRTSPLLPDGSAFYYYRNRSTSVDYIELWKLTTVSAQMVVCDTSDFATIEKYKPQDATTNPSLILAASKKPEYSKLINAAVAWEMQHGENIEDQVDATLDSLLVQFGREILQIVPGKVSTEVDARFSFDTKATVNKALRIIDVGFVTQNPTSTQC